MIPAQHYASSIADRLIALEKKAQNLAERLALLEAKRTAAASSRKKS